MYGAHNHFPIWNVWTSTRPLCNTDRNKVFFLFLFHMKNQRVNSFLMEFQWKTNRQSYCRWIKRFKTILASMHLRLLHALNPLFCRLYFEAFELKIIWINVCCHIDDDSGTIDLYLMHFRILWINKCAQILVAMWNRNETV